jgi:hypothetical protein
MGQPYQPPSFQPQTPAKVEASGAPLLYNKEPNAPRSPPTTHASLYAVGSFSTPTGYNNAAYQSPASRTNLFNTPYPTPSEQPYQPSPSNNMYGAPPEGAGGATGGYKGHAKVY